MSESEDGFIPQPHPGASGIPPRPPKKTARGMPDGPEWRGSIIDELERRLARFPDARVKRTSSSIVCLPAHPGGFRVSLRVRRNAYSEYYSIFYEGSHVETSFREVAVTEFGFALSNGCRLKEHLRQGEAYRRIVEIWDPLESRWKADLEFVPWSRSLWQFWRRPTIRYLQNHLIDLNSDDLRAAA
jgi:hypothetical protein